MALWAYILAGVVGTSLGGLANQFVRGDQTSQAELQADVERPERAA